MEYRKGCPYSPKVKELQNMLNRARLKAMALIREDSQLPTMLNDRYYYQKLHHRNAIKSSWVTIAEDGLFGNATENAVKCFQNFLFITENGILGEFTCRALQNLLSLGLKNDSVLYGSMPKSVISKPSQNDTKNDEELLNICLEYFIKPVSQMTINFVVELQKDFQKNSNRTVKDWNLFVTRARTRLLQLLSIFDKDKNAAYEKLKDFFKKKKKLSPNRHKKSEKYSKNIENLLDKHLGKSRVKLDYNKFIKQMKLGKGLKALAKNMDKVELGIALAVIVGDIGNIDDSTAWMMKWTKDISKLIDVLVGIIVAAIVVFFLPEELSVLVLCLIVGAVGLLVDFLLKCFHKSYLGQALDPIIGEISACIVRECQQEMNRPGIVIQRGVGIAHPY